MSSSDSGHESLGFGDTPQLKVRLCYRSHLIFSSSCNITQIIHAIDIKTPYSSLRIQEKNNVSGPIANHGSPECKDTWL